MSQEQTNYPFSWIFFLSLGLICALEVISLPVNAIEFPAAPQRESPKNTVSGGTRTLCISRAYPIIQPFAPSDDNYIKTVSSQPQLFVYIPKTDAKFLHFVLKEQSGENIDVQEIPLAKIPLREYECRGDYVIMINLPKNLTLKTGKKYQWEVFLFDERILLDYGINRNLRNQYPDIRNYVNMLTSSNYESIRKYTNSRNHSQGIVEKVALTPEVETQLSQNQDIIKQAQIYANQSIWGETLSIAWTLRQSQPEEWNELLTSVGLQKYVDKQVQGACK